MATSKRNATERTCTITEAELNELEMWLEQIQGFAELINSHCEGITSDNGLMTAVNVIAEKAEAVTDVLREGFRRSSRLQ